MGVYSKAHSVPTHSLQFTFMVLSVDGGGGGGGGGAFFPSSINQASFNIQRINMYVRAYVGSVWLYIQNRVKSNQTCDMNNSRP